MYRILCSKIICIGVLLLKLVLKSITRMASLSTTIVFLLSDLELMAYH